MVQTFARFYAEKLCCLTAFLTLQFPFFSFQFGEILFFIRVRSVSLGYLRGAVKPERHCQKNVIERFSKLIGFEGFVLELICLKSLTDLALECSDDWFVLCFKELW